MVSSLSTFDGWVESWILPYNVRPHLNLPGIACAMQSLKAEQNLVKSGFPGATVAPKPRHL